MPTLAVSRDVLDLIEYVEGETIKDKLIGLVTADLASTRSLSPGHCAAKRNLARRNQCIPTESSNVSFPL